MSGTSEVQVRGALRRFTLGSGPLKRGSDRVQVLARLLVVLAFVAAPALAVATANAAGAHLEAVAAEQAADRQQVQALVLQEPRTTASTPDETGLSRIVQAQARWTTPGGWARDGVVLVPPGTRAGMTVPVWVDREGDLTRAPMDKKGIPGMAAGMAVLPLLGVPLVAWTLYVVLCGALDTHRDRRWTAGWASVEPEWSDRLP